MRYVFGVVCFLVFLLSSVLMTESGGTNIMLMTIAVVELWAVINLYLVWRFFGRNK